MKKLLLRLDDLVVDGFATTAVGRGTGTVRAQQDTYDTFCTCVGATCDAAATCLNTCGNLSCAESCGGTCWNPRCQDSSRCP